MTDDQLRFVCVVTGVVAFAFMYRRREAIAHTVRQVTVAVVCAFIAFLLLWKGGLSPLAAYIAALVVVVLIRRAQPLRSRYISARTKRQAIAKWEKETGQTFNRRLHELDHLLAHSRGGGNAEDNIQVLTRKQNRSKGAR
jgi:fatty acid desaturase